MGTILRDTLVADYNQCLRDLQAERARADAAEAQVSALRELVRVKCDYMNDQIRGALTDTAALAQQHDAQVRSAALEEAAKIADTWGEREVRKTSTYGALACETVAKMIRTLAAAGPEKETKK